MNAREGLAKSSPYGPDVCSQQCRQATYPCLQWRTADRVKSIVAHGRWPRHANNDLCNSGVTTVSALPPNTTILHIVLTEPGDNATTTHQKQDTDDARGRLLAPAAGACTGVDCSSVAGLRPSSHRSILTSPIGSACCTTQHVTHINFRPQPTHVQGA